MDQGQGLAKQPMNDEQRKAFNILTVACVVAAAGLVYVVFYLLNRMVPMPWRPGQWAAYGLGTAALLAAIYCLGKLVVVTVRFRRGFK